jgi:predicted MFS family arabinose efflux permease
VSPPSNDGFIGSLSNPGLRKLYSAEAISGLGDGVFWVALVVFLADQPRFGLWLSLAVVARFGPRAFLSVPAGSVVDRSDVRRLLITVDLVRAVLMVALAILVAAGGRPIVLILIMLASYSIASPTRPGLSSIMPAVAGERHLAIANAVVSTIRQIMTFIGPLVGVAVVSWWSSSAGFMVDALTFGMSALILATLSLPAARQGGRSAVTGIRARRRTLQEAVTQIRAESALPILASLIGVMYFVRGAEMVLHVFVVRDQLGQSPVVIGFFGGAIGLGSVLSIPIAARVATTDTPARPILIALVLTAVPTAALAFVEQTFWACAVLVLVGVGMVMFEVAIVMMLQRLTEADSLGRVFGAVNSASNAGKLVGAMVAPILVSVIGLTGSLLVVATLVLVAGAAAARPLMSIGRQAAETRRLLEPQVVRLAQLGIFEGASRSTLERLASAVSATPARSGDVLIREGEDADDLFITIEGQFAVSVGERHLAVLGPDSWFGEIGLLDRRPRTATVTAMSDGLVWRIPGDAFLAALGETGAPPSALMDEMTDRLAAHR